MIGCFNMDELFEIVYKISHLSKLEEMANYQKRDVELPMNVWIERTEKESRGGHYKRLKFQLNKDGHYQQKNSGSVSLADNKIVHRKKLINNKKCQLTTDELNQVENFAYNNNFGLRQLHDLVLSESEFITKVVIKGGKKQGADKILNAIAIAKEIIKNNLNNNIYSDSEIISKAKIALEEDFPK